MQISYKGSVRANFNFQFISDKEYIHSIYRSGALFCAKNNSAAAILTSNIMLFALPVQNAVLFFSCPPLRDDDGYILSAGIVSSKNLREQRGIWRVCAL